MSKLTVSRIPNLNVLVIKQEEGTEFFVSSPNSFIVSVSSLAFILNFLVKNGFLSHKVLEGVLEDFYTDQGDKFEQ